MDLTGSPAALIESGVVSMTDAGDVELSDDYVDSVERYRRLSDEARTTPVQEQVDGAKGRLDSAIDSGLVTHFCALSEWLADTSFETLVPTALVVQAFERSLPPVSGVPEGFVPILGNQLESVIRLHGRTIIYVWREECPPCDVMKEDLEELDSELVRDIGQFAVYGPKWAAHLQKTYDVTGGPVCLFAADGTVQSRLYGSHYPDVIESEIRSLSELA